MDKIIDAKPDSNEPSQRIDLYQGIVIFLFSLGLLLYQLCLTRVLSVVFYYHTAFLAISLAMLGIGAGGVWVYVMSDRSWPDLGRWMIAAGFFLMLCPIFLGLLRFDRTLLERVWSVELMFIFALVAIICLLPFWAGGIIWAWWFRVYRQQSATLYGYDLLGAAVGALLLVPVMENLEGLSALLFCSLLVMLTACLQLYRNIRLHREQGSHGEKMWFKVAAILALFLLIGTFVQRQWMPLNIQISADIRDQKDKRVIFQKWNAFSRIVLLTGQDWHRELSTVRRQHWKARLPKQLHALIDINAYAPFLQFDGDLNKVRFLQEQVSNMGYHLLPPQSRILIIGPGGNRDLLGALLFNPQKVIGIEINPILVRDLALHHLREFIGDLYNHPKIEMHIGEGRAVLQQMRTEIFDLIIANSVATWAAHSSGAMNLAEHGLYTVEACGLYLDRLSAQGILSISLWDLHNHTLPLRWINTCTQAAYQRGITSLKSHTIVLANAWEAKANFTTILISRRPFSDAQIAKIEHLAQQWSYMPLYLPHSDTNQALFEDYFQHPEQFVRSATHDISASTDDRPFFLYTARWTDVWQFWKRRFHEENAALVNLMFSLIVVGLLSSLLILGPLLWLRWRPTRKQLTSSMSNKQPQSRISLSGSDIIYFLMIGWGFMLIEIPLLQRLTLWLGHPTYALTVVLAALLFYSGLGSLCAGYIQKHCHISPHKLASFAILGLCLMLCAITVQFDMLLRLTMDWSLFLRILLALLLLAPLGLLMGIPLPMGMLRLGHSNSLAIPWAWGINGASSVIASVAAIWLAATVGFKLVLLLAAGCYAAAIIPSYRSTAKIKQIDSNRMDGKDRNKERETGLEPATPSLGS